MLTKKVPKSSEIYKCDICGFANVRKSQYERHINTRKHKILTSIDEKGSSALYVCECGKSYKHRQSLFTHKKKCTFINASNESNEINSKELNSKELNSKELKDMVCQLITENNEIKNKLIKENTELMHQINNMIPNIGNNNITNNIINQKINIQIFLNEHCKNALNINEFVKTIKINTNNINLVEKNNLETYLSSAIIENINKLGIYQRPVHCTDIKRETIYIKNNDNWEKDNDKLTIKKALQDVSTEQFIELKKWINVNPDINENEDKQHYFASLLSLLGKANNKKVIKNICNNTYIKDLII
jgi:hypothetical protein